LGPRRAPQDRERPPIEPRRFFVAAAGVDDRGQGRDVDGRFRGCRSATPRAQGQAASRPAFGPPEAPARVLEATEVVEERRGQPRGPLVRTSECAPGAPVELRRKIESSGVAGGHAEAVEGSRAGDGTEAMQVREAQGAREGLSGARIVPAQDGDVAGLDEDLVTEAGRGPPGPPAFRIDTALLDAGAGLVVPGPFEEEAGPLQQHVRDVQAGGTVAPAEEIQGLPVHAQGAGGCALVTELARPLEESARAAGSEGREVVVSVPSAARERVRTDGRRHPSALRVGGGVEVLDAARALLLGGLRRLLVVHGASPLRAES
jgi:hypothetical protein